MRPQGQGRHLQPVHPNGIAFLPDYSGVWIDQDLPSTLDHVAYQFPNPANQSPTPVAHTASYLSLGGNAYADSITTDGAGNIYLAVYGGGEVLEFNQNGIQIGTVSFPPSAPNVTHVAIQPGTRRAFVTASGPGGGHIYTFTALAPAPANPQRRLIRHPAGARAGRRSGARCRSGCRPRR